MKVAYIYNIYLFLLYIKEFYMRIASALSWLSFGVTREATGMVSTFCDSGAYEKAYYQDVYSPYCIVMQLIAVK